MTVATIVASLLPIFWSHRTGAEVMKPLATPVIGGMVSSLLHILIVTPILFVLIREREPLKPPEIAETPPMKPRLRLAARFSKGQSRQNLAYG